MNKEELTPQTVMREFTEHLEDVFVHMEQKMILHKQFKALAILNEARKDLGLDGGRRE